MWSDAINFISNQIDYVNAEEIFNIWSKPPYGIKRGAFHIINAFYINEQK